MSGSFFRQAASLAAGTLAGLVISALTVPIITRLVDPAEYGQYSLFNTYSSMTVMVCSLGLDQTFMRYYYINQQRSVQRRLLSFCVGIPLSLTGLAAAAVLTWHLLDPEAASGSLIWCFLINVALLTLNRAGMLVLRLQYKTGLYSVLNVLHKGLYVALAIPCILLMQQASLDILIISSLASLGICVAGCLLAEKEFWFKTRPAPVSSIRPKELLAYGIPLMIACAVFLVFQATDRLCVKYFGTYADVGVYASAQNLMSVFAVISSTFQTLWIPRAIEHYEKNPQDRRLYQDVNRKMTVIMFAFGACVLLFKDVFVLLLGPDYQLASRIIPFLLLTPIMSTVSETTVIGLAITRHSAGHLPIMCGAALFNLAGNLWLVPAIGIQGAAVSTGLSYILYFSLRTLVASRCFPVKYSLPRFYLLTAIFVLGCLYHLGHGFGLGSLLVFLLTMISIWRLYPEAVRELIAQIRKELALLIQPQGR